MAVDTINRHMEDSRWRDQFAEYTNEIESRLEAGMHVMELGCSAGFWFERLALLERKCVYTGIDISSVSVATARRRYPQAKFLHADLIGFSGLEQANYVISHQCLFFLDRATVERLFQQIRPGSFITLQEPSVDGLNTGSLMRRKPTKVWHLHPYAKILSGLGFRVMTERPVRYLLSTGKERLKVLVTAQRA
jgi:trans-aconitate methyltransferase